MDGWVVILCLFFLVNLVFFILLSSCIFFRACCYPAHVATGDDPVA